jgi:hypothetical protein
MIVFHPKSRSKALHRVFGAGVVSAEEDVVIRADSRRIDHDLAIARIQRFAHFGHWKLALQAFAEGVRVSFGARRPTVAWSPRQG